MKYASIRITILAFLLSCSIVTSLQATPMDDKDKFDIENAGLLLVDPRKLFFDALVHSCGPDQVLESTAEREASVLDLIFDRPARSRHAGIYVAHANCTG